MYTDFANIIPVSKRRKQVKTIQVSIEENLYEELMMLIAKLPNDKIRIRQVVPIEAELTTTTTTTTTSVEAASEYVLRKNAELYERLS